MNSLKFIYSPKFIKIHELTKMILKSIDKKFTKDIKICRFWISVYQYPNR